MKSHSLKQNAKRAAVKLAARFSGIEAVAPINGVDCSTDVWLPTVRVLDGVLPLSIAPEVFAEAHVELPAGWVLSGLTALKAAQASRNDEAIAQRFAALNPDAPIVAGIDPIENGGFAVMQGDTFIHPEAKDVSFEEAQDAVAFMQAVVANGGTNDGMGTLVPAEQVAALDAALAAVKAGSKEAQVFELIRRPAGASASEIGAALNWQLHTSRAYVSVHARRYGLEVVTEKVDGRGTVYRVRVPTQAAA